MRAVIFANGILGDPSEAAKHIQKGDLIIAADGGSLNCLATGRWPDAIVGDFDSLSPWLLADLKKKVIHLLEHPQDKDQTDLELAIEFAINQGVQEILFFGLYGERLDQTLGNLLLLSKDQWKETRMVASSGADTAYLLHSGQSITLVGQPGDIVSLIPLTEFVQGVCADGLRWPLTGAVLNFGTTLSISNTLKAPKAVVAIRSGKLMVTHRKSEQLQSLPGELDKQPEVRI